MSPEITVLIVGLILLAIGIALRAYVARKRFYRRGPGGLQHFSSYGQAVGVGTFEKLVKLIGTLLVIAGIFFLFVVWFNFKSAQKFREKKELQSSAKVTK